MIETLYRIRCDKCGRSDGAHTAERHEQAVDNLLDQHWMVVPATEWGKFSTYICPNCGKEANHEQT